KHFWVPELLHLGPVSPLVAPSDCGGHYTDEYGRIFNYVGPKTECVWIIELNPGDTVMVAIPKLKGFACGKEYVEVLDGPPGSESLGRICEAFSTFYHSSSNIITIKYSREPRKNFIAYYYSAPKGKNKTAVFPRRTLIVTVRIFA
uniref:CUB domain-containing protein n=1 Tax=Piliocolobus tephrosceles TaxID=591936 RepID=A0A8C9I8U3_9PRIM